MQGWFNIWKSISVNNYINTKKYTIWSTEYMQKKHLENSISIHSRNSQQSRDRKALFQSEKCHLHLISYLMVKDLIPLRLEIRKVVCSHYFYSTLHWRFYLVQ